jgi:hypothetical protein
MKKILSFLATFALLGSTSTTIISCTVEPNPHHVNPDYQPEEINQSPTTKQAISEAIQTRIKAAILTDNYHLNKEQVTHAAFQMVSNNDENLETIYQTYFDENTLAQSVEKDSQIDLNGTKGYSGGLIDLILQQLNLSEVIKQILVNFLNLDLDSQTFKDQITDLLILASDMVQGFNTQVLTDELPLLLTKIPNDLFDQIPTVVANTISDVVQSTIDNFANVNLVNPVLDALISGSDLTRFNDLSVNQVFDAFFVNLTNFLGYGIDPEFDEFSDTKLDNYDALGT